MRIVQLGPFPPPNGGVQTNLKAIHDRLGERGHDAAVIAITNASRTDGVPNAYKPRSVFQLVKLLLTLKFDIVHLHVGGNFSLRLAALMWLCGHLPGRKSVVTFHSGGYAREAVQFAKPFSFRGAAFRSIGHLIGVNEQMLEMFRAFGVREDKMSLVLPFVLRQPDPDLKVGRDLNEFAANHQPFLLTVSGLEEEYGLTLQTDAFDRILKKFPNAGLMILGSGSLEDELRRLIASKTYASKIFLVGDVEREIVLHLVNRADALLRTTHYDGDAVSVREALFLQTPVIATDNGMRPEGVFLIPSPPDIDSLVDKVATVLEKNVEKKIAHRAGGWENIEAVLAIYEELMRK